MTSSATQKSPTQSSMSPTNAIQEIVHDIPVTDIRPIKDALTLEKDGVLVRELHTKMQHDDFASPAAVQNPYLPRVQEMLQKELGTGNVAILEYLVREPTHGVLIRCLPKGSLYVRRRDPICPLSPGREFEFAQPVPTAHIGNGFLYKTWRGEYAHTADRLLPDGSQRHHRQPVRACHGRAAPSLSLQNRQVQHHPQSPIESRITVLI